MLIQECLCRVGANLKERGMLYTFDNAIKIDGFNHGAGKLDEKQVAFLLGKIKSKLDLNPDDFLLKQDVALECC